MLVAATTTSEISFSYSTDGTTFSPRAVPYTTPAAADPSPTWGALSFRTTIGALGIAPGDFFFFRVEAVGAGGSGSYDELALVSVSLTPSTPGACVADLDCDDVNECTTDTCEAGTCRHRAVPTGTSCDDHDACTAVSLCGIFGTCDSGVRMTCDDANPCTADSCDAVSGCTNTPTAVGTSCADGDTCNGDETCDGAGTCQMGTALDCDDGDDCTTDTCDAALGCQNDPIPMCGGDDAGVVADGGVSTTDGGVVTDGGVSATDGGATGSDAGPPDGGRDGCGCHPSRPSSAPLWWLAPLAGAVLWSRRRRRPHA